MKSRILHLPILQVVPGTTLALAILDRAGRTLFAADTLLDDTMLDRLNKRGIESCAVNVDDDRSPETIAQQLQDAEARARHIFRGSGSPARDALQAAVLDYRRECTQ